jgi:hypothetical protein
VTAADDFIVGDLRDPLLCDEMIGIDELADLLAVRATPRGDAAPFVQPAPPGAAPRGPRAPFRSRHKPSYT